MYVVLEDLVVHVTFLDQVLFLLPKICSIKCYLLFADLTLVAVEYKTMLLCYLHQL